METFFWIGIVVAMIVVTVGLLRRKSTAGSIGYTARTPGTDAGLPPDAGGSGRIVQSGPPLTNTAASGVAGKTAAEPGPEGVPYAGDPQTRADKRRDYRRGI
ncbi:hypothetical protein [Arthrobacter zhaoguopingii]|uniref:hypothetical protein n=1 Tax=Arthrobacter zhaoguopingii TaxID=2681491 RepID=UPI001359D6E2|nr:hypothetical protein [Arthrobacter zhaoguopingii]